MGSGMGFTRGQGYKRKLSMEALFALGAAIGTLLKMGRSMDAAQHAQERINLGKGFPLMRKFMRPANPAEVRTDYKYGPWGTSAKPGLYTYLAATGQCLDVFDLSLRPMGAIEAENNRVYRVGTKREAKAHRDREAEKEWRRMESAARRGGKTSILKRWREGPSRFAQKEN